LVTCPNCGRRNSADNAFCANCGFRLPTAAARGHGVAYRRKEQAEPHGGGGQGLLAFGAVLLAGLLFAVGAVALLMSPSAEASRTPTAVGAGDTTSSLPVFIQETPTPLPLPSVTPLPSYALFTPTPPISIVPPSFSSVPPFTVPPATATPTPAPSTPKPTPTATPVTTPANCASSDGSNTRSVIIGYGNPGSVGPIPRAWCIRQTIIRPFIEGSDTSSTGLPGETRLLENDRRLSGDTCAADECNDKARTFSPPHFTPDGSTFTYEFTCIDNPGTPEIDECTLAGGATIEILYEVVRGT
jgi:hypothetical protein